ncbi:hypothetical protein HDU96_006166 [Phlyctochytrium bullatum]|nr:hypothetical protein HDU96_006166 [Phlyctochytrium bullatum]
MDAVTASTPKSIKEAPPATTARIRSLTTFPLEILHCILLHLILEDLANVLRALPLLRRNLSHPQSLPLYLAKRHLRRLQFHETTTADVSFRLIPTLPLLDLPTVYHHAVLDIIRGSLVAPAPDTSTEIRLSAAEALIESVVTCCLVREWRGWAGNRHGMGPVRPIRNPRPFLDTLQRAVDEGWVSLASHFSIYSWDGFWVFRAIAWFDAVDMARRMLERLAAEPEPMRQSRPANPHEDFLRRCGYGRQCWVKHLRPVCLQCGDLPSTAVALKSLLLGACEEGSIEVLEFALDENARQGDPLGLHRESDVNGLAMMRDLKSKTAGMPPPGLPGTPSKLLPPPGFLSSLASKLPPPPGLPGSRSTTTGRRKRPQRSALAASLLHVSARRGHVAVLSRLLDRGVGDGVAQDDEEWWTPVFHAAAGGHADVVAMLLGRGASVDDEDTQGRTCFEVSEEKGSWEVVEVLEAWERRRRGRVLRR